MAPAFRMKGKRDDRIQHRAFQCEARPRQDFLDAHNRPSSETGPACARQLIKTGDGDLLHHRRVGRHGQPCRRAAVHAATLDSFRDTLDGDTDPVSGPVVLELK